MAFCISDEPKYELARDLGDRLQSRKRWINNKNADVINNITVVNQILKEIQQVKDGMDM